MEGWHLVRNPLLLIVILAMDELQNVVVVIG